MVKYSKVRKKEKLPAAEQVDFNEVCGELHIKCRTNVILQSQLERAHT